MVRPLSTLAPFSDPFTRRIFLSLTVPVIIIGAAFNLVYLHQQKVSNTERFIENTRSAVDLFARSLRIAVFSSDLDTIEVLADSLLGPDDFLAVTVFDADFGPLVRTGRSASDAVPPRELSTRLRTGGVVAVHRGDRIDFWTAVPSARRYEREADLYLDPEAPPRTGEVVGFVRLTTTTAGIRAAVIDGVRRNAVSTLLFLVVGAVVAYVVVSQVNRPLRDLLAQVSTRGDVEANAGLSHLSDRFLSLVTQLDQAFDTIRQLNASLENRVAERTNELARTNAALHEEVRQRRRAQEALQQAHDQLEEKVVERTAELEHTHAQLRHAEKLTALGRLAASLAHEFNNPICGVRNCLEELRHGLPAGGEEAEIAELAIKECRRMAALTRSLRQLSRPSGEGLALVDAGACLADMVRLVRKEFDRAGIRMVLESPPELPRVRATEDQLKQVFLNLLQNAHDAMDGGGGTVWAGARPEDGQVAVSVRDEGRGIDSEHLPRIFEPFFSTKSAVKSTGLGLSVSNGIVERFGGRVEVESSPGRGSTFTVWLPAEEEAQA